MNIDQNLVESLALAIALLSCSSPLLGEPPELGYSDTLDIADTGACRSNTDDDAPVVQMLLTDAPDGALILVPCMVGVGRSGLVLKDKRRVTLKGVDYGGIKSLAYVTGGYQRSVLLLERCTSCTVRRLHINGNYQNNIMLELFESDSVTVQGNSIWAVGSPASPGDPPSAALTSYGGHANRYLQNRIENVAGPFGGPGSYNAPRGMWIGNWWPEAQEHDALIRFNYIADVCATFIAAHVVRATIEANTLEHVKPHSACSAAGIKYVQPVEGVAGMGTTRIEGNRIVDTGGIAFDTDVGVTPNHSILVLDNYIQGSRYSSISGSSAGRFANVTIMSNTLLNAESTIDVGGILLFNAKNVLISHNTIRDTRPVTTRQQIDGIQLIGLGGNRDNPSDGKYWNLRIQCNDIRGNWRAGITFDGDAVSDYLELTSNTIADNGELGLLAYDGFTHRNSDIARNAYSGNGAGPEDDAQGIVPRRGSPTC